MGRSSIPLVTIACAAFAASGCSSQNVSCPSNARLQGGVCRPICMHNSDCLVNERCDAVLGVCTASEDGGSIDSGTADAGRSDALPFDAESIDAAGSDAGAHDARNGDAAERDGRAMDTGLADGPSGDAFVVDATSDASVDAGGGDAGPDGGACAGLDQAACMAKASCLAHFCSGCNHQQIYAGCTEVGAPPPVCPLIVCPGCGIHSDVLSCAQDTACHPVYMDQTPCTCTTSGCCMQFWFCAEGPRAVCQGMPTCSQPAPVCEGDYTVSYTSSCYEGCVHPTECG